MDKRKKWRSGYKKKRPRFFPKPKNVATLPTTPTGTTPDPTATASTTSASVPTTSDVPVPVVVQSRSAKKIVLARSFSGLCTPSTVEQSDDDYLLFKRRNLARALSAFSCCDTPLLIMEDRIQRRGFVSKLEIFCSVCWKMSTITNPYCDEDRQVNTRAVLAARMAGYGRSGLADFAGVMGMVPPVTSHPFTHCNAKLLFATRDAAEADMRKAARELRGDVGEEVVVDVKVTCDGTWQKRGHQNLYGVVVVASWDTGKVLDIEVLSKHCQECSRRSGMDPSSPAFLDWWETHQDMCAVNYHGSSGGMEVEGAKRIWQRSVQRHNLRYTAMIADGDSSTYSTLSAAMPYGREYSIIKHECVGHVQKRMFSHLSALKKKQHRNKQGKIIRMGGRGRMTNVLMKKLQKYYGKAIRSNVGDPGAMKRAVMAIYYHSISNDKNPQHLFCPPGDRSWCKFQRALAKGESPPHHNQTICDEIAPIVKKVFDDLSCDSLMERCVLGATQNQNESFNSMIWNRCPKTDFCSAVVVELAANLAVLAFNSGRESLKQVLERLQLPCGPSTEAYLQAVDSLRVWSAEYKEEELVKKRRQQMRLDRVVTEEEQVAAEGVQYGPGLF